MRQLYPKRCPGFNLTESPDPPSRPFTKTMAIKPDGLDFVLCGVVNPHAGQNETEQPLHARLSSEFFGW